MKDFDFENALPPNVKEDIEPSTQKQTNYDYERSQIKKSDAETNDIKALTKIKKNIVDQTLFFTKIWIGLNIIFTIIYFGHQILLCREIPKEVMIAIFSTTAIVVGLVGFILKGLFGSRS